MRAATKAMKEALILNNIEGRCFFIVKWAETDIFATTTNQLYTATNDLRQRDTLAQLVKEAWRKRHG